MYTSVSSEYLQKMYAVETINIYMIRSSQHITTLVDYIKTANISIKYAHYLVTNTMKHVCNEPKPSFMTWTVSD